MDSTKLESLDALSRSNVIIQRMIKEGLPFNRQTYLDIFYAGQIPGPWTFKHESLLPPVFRSEVDTEQQREALQNLNEAIGIAYNGEVPS
jgi:hypothetical protein